MAMEEGKAARSLKVPTFDSEHKGFQIWWMRFKVYGTIYGYAQSIQETIDPHVPATEGTTLDANADTATLQKQTPKLNSIAMCRFTMTFTTKSLMGMVHLDIDTDCPSGLAQQVVSLQEKYAPEDMVSKIELHYKMNAIVMRKEEALARLFKKISGLQNRYNTSNLQISTEDMISMVLEKN
eukprot:4083987-Ditylum_brightwellii.AAC.1